MSLPVGNCWRFLCAAFLAIVCAASTLAATIEAPDSFGRCQMNRVKLVPEIDGRILLFAVGCDYIRSGNEVGIVPLPGENRVFLFTVEFGEDQDFRQRQIIVPVGNPGPVDPIDPVDPETNFQKIGREEAVKVSAQYRAVLPQLSESFEVHAAMPDSWTYDQLFSALQRSNRIVLPDGPIRAAWIPALDAFGRASESSNPSQDAAKFKAACRDFAAGLNAAAAVVTPNSIFCPDGTCPLPSYQTAP